MANFDKKSILFYILIFTGVITFVYSLFQNLYKINIKYFGNVLEPVTINLKLNNNSQNDIMACFNNNCKMLIGDKYNNIYSIKFSQNTFKNEFTDEIIKNISLVSKNNSFINQIENIYLYVGNKSYFYDTNDIKEFKNKDIKIKLDNSNNTETYKLLKIPNNVKSNYRGILNHFALILLFPFYCWKKFILTYLLMFTAFIYKKIYDIKLNIKFNHFIVFALILLTGIFLRINGLFYYPLWADELYTKTIAITSFKNCFLDPGNPPFYYLLQYFITSIFNNSDFVMKSLSAGISFLFPVCAYLLFKPINKNMALFSAFYCAINIINIYHSQELRSSGLCMVLTILSIKLLLDCIENFNNKKVCFYALLTAIAVNTHYYLAIFAFLNFLYGIFKIKPVNNKIKFLTANLFSALTFLPYLIYSSSTALNKNFNSWIGEFNLDKVNTFITDFFGGIPYIVIVLFVILLNIIILNLPNKLKEKFNISFDLKLNKLFIYILYSIITMFCVFITISIVIKPVFHSRLCISIYSLFIILEIILINCIFNCNKNNKLFYTIKAFLSVAVFCMFLTVTHPLTINRICTINDYIKFIEYDSNKYIKDGYEIHGILTDYAEYLKYYGSFAQKNVIWHFLNGNTGEFMFDFNKSTFTKSKKVVIYFNSIGVSFDSAIETKNNAYVINTNLIPLAKVIYDK